MGWLKQPHFHERIEEMATAHARKLTMKVLRGVVIRTPVDTGRLRANWQVGLNSEPNTELEEKTGAMMRGGAVIKNISFHTKTIYVVNNLPYAEYIENGHGGRNPGVMVWATLLQLKLS